MEKCSIRHNIMGNKAVHSINGYNGGRGEYYVVRKAPKFTKTTMFPPGLKVSSESDQASEHCQSVSKTNFSKKNLEVCLTELKPQSSNACDLQAGPHFKEREDFACISDGFETNSVSSNIELVSDFQKDDKASIKLFRQNTSDLVNSLNEEVGTLPSGDQWSSAALNPNKITQFPVLSTTLGRYVEDAVISSDNYAITPKPELEVSEQLSQSKRQSLSPLQVVQSGVTKSRPISRRHSRDSAPVKQPTVEHNQSPSKEGFHRESRRSAPVRHLLKTVTARLPSPYSSNSLSLSVGEGVSDDSKGPKDMVSSCIKAEMHRLSVVNRKLKKALSTAQQEHTQLVRQVSVAAHDGEALTNQNEAYVQDCLSLAEMQAELARLTERENSAKANLESRRQVNSQLAREESHWKAVQRTLWRQRRVCVLEAERSLERLRRAERQCSQLAVYAEIPASQLRLLMLNFQAYYGRLRVFASLRPTPETSCLAFRSPRHLGFQLPANESLEHIVRQDPLLARAASLSPGDSGPLNASSRCSGPWLRLSCEVAQVMPPSGDSYAAGLFFEIEALLDTVVEGFNACFVALGPVGTGKTTALFGVEEGEEAAYLPVSPAPSSLHMSVNPAHMQSSLLPASAMSAKVLRSIPSMNVTSQEANRLGLVGLTLDQLTELVRHRQTQRDWTDCQSVGSQTANSLGPCILASLVEVELDNWEGPVVDLLADRFVDMSVQQDWLEGLASRPIYCQEDVLAFLRLIQTARRRLISSNRIKAVKKPPISTGSPGEMRLACRHLVVIIRVQPQGFAQSAKMLSEETSYEMGPIASADQPPCRSVRDSFALDSMHQTANSSTSISSPDSAFTASSHHPVVTAAGQAYPLHPTGSLATSGILMFVDMVGLEPVEFRTPILELAASLHNRPSCGVTLEPEEALRELPQQQGLIRCRNSSRTALKAWHDAISLISALGEPCSRTDLTAKPTGSRLLEVLQPCLRFIGSEPVMHRPPCCLSFHLPCAQADGLTILQTLRLLLFAVHRQRHLTDRAIGTGRCSGQWASSVGRCLSDHPKQRPVPKRQPDIVQPVDLISLSSKSPLSIRRTKTLAPSHQQTG